MSGTFRVSRLPRLNLFFNDLGFEFSCTNANNLQLSFYKDCLYSESTAFISFSVETFRKVWRYEKLTHSVQCTFESLVTHIKMIVRVRKTRVSVARTSIICYVHTVLVFLWIFPTSHEKHMFQKVRYALVTHRV